MSINNQTYKRWSCSFCGRTNYFQGTVSSNICVSCYTPKTHLEQQTFNQPFDLANIFFNTTETVTYYSDIAQIIQDQNTNWSFQPLTNEYANEYMSNEETKQKNNTNLIKDQMKIKETKQTEEQNNDDTNMCKICFENKLNMRLGCGHITCEECCYKLQQCPFCRKQIILDDCLKIYL